MKTISDIQKKVGRKIPQAHAWVVSTIVSDAKVYTKIQHREEFLKYLKSSIQELLESVVPEGYREGDTDWSKGKNGNRVKWYGQGFNEAVRYMRENIERVTK